MSRVYGMSVASVYVHYIAKVEKKGRSKAEVDEAIRWLTGYSQAELDAHLAKETTFADFFDGADLNPHADRVTGSICGVKIQEIEDPLMWRIRVLDKLVDEIAKGRSMDKVLRA